MKRVTVLALLLVAVTLAVYSAVAQHDFVLLDDPDYVTGNSHVRDGLTADGIAWAFGTYHAANWHPLTWLSHMLDAELVGQRAGGHHVVNLVLHALNALLLFVALRSLTGALWPSVFVAALFALHPINVESVAWVAERKNTLSTAFWMLTLLAYGSYARRGGAGRYVAVVLLFAAGLLSKPMLVTLPVVLLLLDVWPLDRWGPVPARRLLLEKVPLGLMAALVAIPVVHAQGVGGTLRDTVELAPAFRLANAVVSYARYLAKSLWPSDLAVVYPHPSIASGTWPWPATTVVVSAAALLGISALVLWLTLRGRANGRYRYLAVGWSWYLVTLLPVIGIVQAGPQAMADRYAYVTLVGVWIMAAWGAADVIASRPGARLPLVALGLAVIVGSMGVTVTQLRFWKDSETLFRHSLDVTENNWLIHSILGSHLALEQRFDESLSHTREAIRIHPTHAKAHHNLGNILQVRGRHDDAIAALEEAVRLEPEYHRARLKLGVSYEAVGRSENAAEQLRRLTELVDDHVEGHYRLGLIHARAGRGPEALQRFGRVLELQPDARAMDAMARILVTFPDMRDPERAIALAERALALDPERPEVLRTLAAAYAAAERWDDAVDTAGRARGLALDADNFRLGSTIERELARYMAAAAGEVAP